MAKYYLHLRTRTGCIEDNEGAVIATPESACQEGRMAARDLVAERIRGAKPLDLTDAVIVMDQMGRVILVIELGSAMAYNLNGGHSVYYMLSERFGLLQHKVA